MSILFAGIVMSHYTHHNLSPVTQILMQQTLRAVAFMCGQHSGWFPHFLPQVSPSSTLSIRVFCIPFSETCVFAFLGLSIFSFPHKFEISFVIWCIVRAPSLLKMPPWPRNQPNHASARLSAGSGASGTGGEHLPPVLPAELLQRPQDHPQNDVHHVV